MLNVLRYESRGQRQWFEPREQESNEAGQRHIHLHLSLHVHPNLGVRCVVPHKGNLAIECLRFLASSMFFRHNTMRRE
jgi:hypothetical protein